jgi:predicted DNA binding CopG/RHH family protein
MAKDPLVKIKNMTKAAKHLGIDAARNRGIPISEFKNYITPKEVQSIIKQYAIKDDSGNYMLNHKLLMKICEEIDSWILGIELSKLASTDQLETYWDDNKNCMVFKYKEGDINGKEAI